MMAPLMIFDESPNTFLSFLATGTEGEEGSRVLHHGVKVQSRIGARYKGVPPVPDWAGDKNTV